VRIIIEDWNSPCPVGLNEYKQFTLKIGEEDFHFQIQDYYWDSKIVSNMYNMKDTYYKIVAERIPELTVKTEQEEAAEESVVKAKEALKAAENALKVVKQSK
jgi:hypothetical protein